MLCMISGIFRNFSVCMHQNFLNPDMSSPEFTHQYKLRISSSILITFETLNCSNSAQLPVNIQIEKVTSCYHW